MNQHHPHHPIIYVRGFAATQGEIEDTVADPYMGFNLGSTKTRTVWTGDVKRFFFESPLVRLMGDEDYDDVFVDGEDLLSVDRADRPIGYKCVIIYRYYDEASDVFGTGQTPPITHFAQGLSTLIKKLRDRVCANPQNGVAPKDFRAYLVAHSMGGLICRAFLQNAKLDPENVRGTIDKMFTYATPHNGIDLRIVRNVPGWATFGDVNNFNRDKMAGYLALPKNTEDVSQVQGFPADRIFNLVGTNPADYGAAGGLSAWAAGEASDGLVRIENATTFGIGPNKELLPSPRAFVNRSHSGHYGIVNSEEGYQNLRRFLFGKLRVDGYLDIDEITLPTDVQKDMDDGKKVKASYQFEVAVSIRGYQWQIHRRAARENSAIFRTFDEMFPQGRNGKRAADRTRSPHLMSVFLDPSKSTTGGSVSFAVDLNVLVPDYQVDGKLFLKKHYEGGFIYRELLLIEAFPDEAAPAGWRVKYGYQRNTPGQVTKNADTKATKDGGLQFSIPVEQTKRPGITAALRVHARAWT